MKILVTGASGFIGVTICSKLLSCGHQVIGLQRHAYPPTNAAQSHQVVIAHIEDRTEIEEVRRKVGQCGAIVHAAASLDMSFYAPEVSLTNCLGLQNILWLAEQWGTKHFIFVSSIPVIGVPLIFPIGEDHPSEPATAYHASKLFGEHLVRIAAIHGINGVSLRVPAPVGPNLPGNRLLSIFVRRAINNEAIEITGRGSRQQNYVDVRDIARATVLTLQHQVSGVFNIAGSSTISNLELARHCIERCHSKSEIVFNSMKDPEEGYTWDVSIDKAREVLGYVPKYNIDDAVDAAIADYQADRVRVS